MKRAAIVVRDLARSLEFYRRVLGLAVWVEGEAGPDNAVFARLVGLPPCHIRYVILRAAGVTQGMVGLFEIRGASLPECTHADPAAANLGEVVLVFEASDVEAIHRDAAEAGLRVVCAPQHLRIPELGVESLEMSLRDPNGVLVNLIQPLNARPESAAAER
jgi:catechol 2,3-dioxygenase-like lactoylglutathione lyase family enzyme